MSDRSAMFLFITGLLLTMLGVGGIEQSINNSELLAMVLVSMTGCGIMFCGTLGMRNDY